MVGLRGISYLIDEPDSAEIRRGVEIIANELHCTAVMLIGREPRRLSEAARHALDTGLEVYLRPDATDLPRAEMLTHLDTVAAAAQALRRDHPGRVTLLVGSEFSHTVPGIVPGPRSLLRLHLVLRCRRLLRRRIARRLGRLLPRAVAVARHRFDGPITYAAAEWEEVDWTLFDIVGVNLYRAAGNQATYSDRVRALVRDHDRPVVVTEFGCGAFSGADLRGAGSFRIVDWFAEPPRIRGDHPRDELVQARYLTELIDLYEAEGVHGCFVFTFVMPDFPHRDDPGSDLDRAGFGLVAVGEGGAFRRKEAFHAVAGRYRAERTRSSGG